MSLLFSCASIFIVVSLFENFIISELSKNSFNQGRRPSFYFWRDKSGHEIDLIIEKGQDLTPIEIKAGYTLNSDFFKNLDYWSKLTPCEQAYLVYCGNVTLPRRFTQVLNWANLEAIKELS